MHRQAITVVIPYLTVNEHPLIGQRMVEVKDATHCDCRFPSEPYGQRASSIIKRGDVPRLNLISESLRIAARRHPPLFSWLQRYKESLRYASD